MKETIYQYFAGIVNKLGFNPATIVIESPENVVHGDYTTNVAMMLAGHLKAPPRTIAQKIVDQIKEDQKKSSVPWLDHVEIAGPGFINLFLSEVTLSSSLAEVLKEKERYGQPYYTGVTQEKTGSEGQKLSSNNKKKVSQKNYDEKGPKNGKKMATNNREKNAVAEKGIRKGGLASRGNTSTPLWSANVSDQSRAALVANKNLDPSSNSLAASAQSVHKDRSRSQGEAGQNFVRSPQHKTIMVEFAHPNTHKAFHIGHLRNITTGESIVRLLESQGNKVIRANYQGDVGMHIAKAMYALLNVSPFKDQVHKVTGIKNRVEFLGKAYAAGSKAFEEDEKAKEKIKDYNYLVYAAAERFVEERGLLKASTDYLAFVKGEKSIVDTVFSLWKETRQWSLDYFDTVYRRVYSHFDRFYFESECLSGVDRAKDAVKKGVLKESDGAIIFEGKPYGIDTRVFVNSLGLPTYEGKELALAGMETKEHGELTTLIHCVGPEQASFFKVTFKAEELLGIVKSGVQYHLAYGWVKLKKGKMSSRLGNVVLGEWLVDEVKKEVKNIIESNTSKQIDIDKEEVSEALAIGAIKYAFLKVSTPSEIAFDLKESININGDSGPYLQYTYARCRSVLRKAGPDVIARNESSSDAAISTNERLLRRGNGLAMTMNPEERAIARFIMQFPDVVADAASRYAPNALCTYLFQLAQAFNLFYAKHTIIGGKGSVVSIKEKTKDNSLNTKYTDHNTASLRLALTAATAQVIQNGLYLLGINTLERM